MRAPDEEDLETIENSRAPLVEHLIELRQRLVRSLVAVGLLFAICFFFADDIFNILLIPYERAAQTNTQIELIYTAPHEYFFTQMKLALFGALFFAFPIIASQIYMFVAPGLYRHERQVFVPYLIATPVLFFLGATLAYYVIMPFAFGFFLSMEQAGSDTQASIQLMPRVSEYLSFIMMLIFAFGICFQLPVLLTLLARAGLVTAAQLRRWRKFAVVGFFALAAVLTPPDFISQIALAVPTLFLYELSIFAVMRVERRTRETRQAS